MKREKDKMETARNSKYKRERKEQSMVETGENKDKDKMVELENLRGTVRGEEKKEKRKNRKKRKQRQREEI